MTLLPDFTSMKIFLTGGLIAAVQGTPESWVQLLERWGIAAVWALIAYMLWKKQEKSDANRIQLQERIHQDQLENTQKLYKLITKQTESNNNTAAAIHRLADKK